MSMSVPILEAVAWVPVAGSLVEFLRGLKDSGDSKRVGNGNE